MSALKSFGAALLAIIGAIGGLDAASVISVMPAQWGAWIVTAISVCAAVYHLLDGSGKAASGSDAKTSAQKLSTLLLLASIASLSMAMTSCSLPWSVTTPYGNLSNSQSGGTVYTPPAEPIHLNSGK